MRIFLGILLALNFCARLEAVTFSLIPYEKGAKKFAVRASLLLGKKVFRFEAKPSEVLPLFDRHIALSSKETLILGWLTVEEGLQVTVAWIIREYPDRIEVVDRIHWSAPARTAGFVFERRGKETQIGLLKGPKTSLYLRSRHYDSAFIESWEEREVSEEHLFLRYNPPFFRRDPLGDEKHAWVKATPTGFQQILR